MIVSPRISSDRSQDMNTPKVLFVFALGAYCISLVQGSIGPLAFLGGQRVLITSGVVALLLGLFMRIRAGGGSSKPLLLNVALYVTTFWLILSAAFGISNDSQWIVLGTYLSGFAVSLIVPNKLRMLPLVAITLASAIQVISAFVFSSYMVTLSGVRQLSGGVQPNILSLEAVLVAVVLAWYACKASKPTWVRVISAAGLLFFIWAVILTVSRSGLISLVVGIFFVVILNGSRLLKMRLSILVVICSVVLFFILGWWRFVEEWFVRGDEGSISTLTGRTSIWDEALAYGLQKPLLGWGFGGLYKSDYSAGSFLSEVRGTNSHNLLLQLFVETGAFGVFLFLMIICLAFVFIWRGVGTRGLLLPLVILVIVNGSGSAGAATVGIAAVLLGATLTAITPGGVAIKANPLTVRSRSRVNS